MEDLKSLSKGDEMKYTTNDYFEPVFDGYGWYSPCDDRMDADLQWLGNRFTEFMRRIDCRETRWSEWGYSVQCHGIQIEPDDGGYCRRFIPRDADLPWSNEYVRIWDENLPRMRTLYEWIEDVETHLSDVPCGYDHDGFEYAHKRDRKLDERLDVAIRAYEKLVDEVLERIAGAYQDELVCACEYAMSDDAAEEWASYMNECFE